MQGFGSAGFFGERSDGTRDEADFSNAGVPLGTDRRAGYERRKVRGGEAGRPGEGAATA